MKICTKCGSSLDLDHFSKSSKNKDGLSSKCKSCVREYYAEHYKNNKEIISEKRKRSRSSDPETKRAYYRKYYSEHKEAWKEYCLKWYRKNKFRFVACWNKNAHIKHIPSWADLEAILKIYQECEDVSQRTGIVHHVDHIIPINGETVSGFHIHTNLRIVPAEVNLKKGNKLMPELCGAP